MNESRSAPLPALPTGPNATAAFPSPTEQPAVEREGLGRFSQLLLGRYCVLEEDLSVRIVDLTAVAYRIAIRHLDVDREGFIGESRPLLIPARARVPSGLTFDSEACLDALATVGFDLDEVQHGLFLVKRVPYIAAEVDHAQWVEAMIEAFARSKSVESVSQELARLWAFEQAELDTYAARALLAEARDHGVRIATAGVSARLDIETLNRLIAKGEG